MTSQIGFVDSYAIVADFQLRLMVITRKRNANVGGAAVPLRIVDRFLSDAIKVSRDRVAFDDRSPMLNEFAGNLSDHCRTVSKFC